MKYVQERVLFCNTCGRDTKHMRNATKPNYLLHLLLSIITFGLWIPIAFLAIFGGIEITGEPWRCNSCGSKYSNKFSAVSSKIILYLGIFVFSTIGAVFTSSFIGDAFDGVLSKEYTAVAAIVSLLISFIIYFGIGIFLAKKFTNK